MFFRYGEVAIDEIAQSISCLAHHGILVVNLVTQTAAAAAANGGGAAATGPQTAGQNSTGKNGVNTSQVHFRYGKNLIQDITL